MTKPEQIIKPEPATIKQKNFITTLHERKRLAVPDVSELTKVQASRLIKHLTSY